MLNPSVKDYILVIENAITDSLCNKIIEEFNDENEWLSGGLSNHLIDKKIRNAERVLISHPHVIEKNKSVRKELDDYLYITASNTIQKYASKFNHCYTSQDSGYELLRYKEGQFYVEHTDSYIEIPRTISCSFALNDNYEGGEWGFFNRELTFKAPKGSAVCFPSNFMYPHEILPVTCGVRYSIITWFI